MRGLGEMAGQENLLRASLRRAAREPGRAVLDDGITSALRTDLRQPHSDLHVTDVSSRLGFGEIDDLLDDAPTLRIEKRDRASVEHLTDATVNVPATKRFAAWSRRYLMLVAAADALVGGVAAAVPASISDTLSGQHNTVLIISLIGLIVWPTAIALCRGYRRNRIGVGFDEPGAVMRAGMAVVVACALPTGLMAVPSGALDPNGVGVDDLRDPEAGCNRYALCGAAEFGGSFSRPKGFASTAASGALSPTCRCRWQLYRGAAAQRAHSLRAERRHEGDWHLPSVRRAAQARGGRTFPVLGSLSQVSAVVRAKGCDAVAVTSDDATRYNYLRELAWSLEGCGVELLVDPGLVEVAGPRMHIRPLMGFPLLHVEEPHFTGWRRVVKRMSDLLLASVGLLIILPVMLGIAAAIKIQDRGPVLFRQARIGREGKPFTMLKFRSMVVDAEDRKLELMANNEGKGGLFKLSHDPRVTRLGRFLRDFSLDELPQLFNVLAGSMSLVGPRPHLASELAQMPTEASRRSLVTPGLTGLWQVSGRSDLEGVDAIRLDLRYVENWSLSLDLQILWKTISAVLARRGAA